MSVVEDNLMTGRWHVVVNLELVECLNEDGLSK